MSVYFIILFCALLYATLEFQKEGLSTLFWVIISATLGFLTQIPVISKNKPLIYTIICLVCLIVILT